jgi:hypothetical protein
MGALTRALGRASLVGVVTVGLMVASLIALLRFRANSRWLVLIGAIVALLTNGFHLVTIETDKTVTISGCLSTKALSWMPRSS